MRFYEPPKRKNRRVLFLVFAVGALVLIATFYLNGLSLRSTLQTATIVNLLPFTSNPNGDLESQKPLAIPPKIIKAIYATSWSAGNESKISRLISLAAATEINSIVIDVKDYSGAVSYENDIPLVVKYGTAEKRIPKINTLIKRLHDAGIYAIARVVVFEDQKLSEARPDLVLKSKKTGGLWATYKGQHWMDAAARDVWDYNIAIAKDALARGFDEINFDYIRFASDGDLADIAYPIYDGHTPKKEVIRKFFEYIRATLGEARVSADLFGMSATNKDDLGIGQYLENALPYFDAVSPMVYPSHYISGFLGYKNPARAPYEVVKYSLDAAVARMKEYENQRQAYMAAIAGAANATTLENPPARENPPPLEGTPFRKGGILATSFSKGGMIPPAPLPIRAKLRPWLQDFNLGAIYDAEKVLAQIKATYDAALGCIAKSINNHGIICDSILHPEALGDLVGGWMLWNPSNIYTKGALSGKTIDH